MAKKTGNPQLEDGYTRIANELYEAIYSTDLTASAQRVLHCIIRKTYGFNKIKSVIPFAEIVKGVKLPDTTVARALRELKSRKIIFRNHGSETQVNKKYKGWLPTAKNGSAINGSKRTTKNGSKTTLINGSKSTTENGSNNNNIKDNILKTENKDSKNSSQNDGNIVVREVYHKFLKFEGDEGDYD